MYNWDLSSFFRRSQLPQQWILLIPCHINGSPVTHHQVDTLTFSKLNTANRKLILN